ncbi:MAG: FAD-binding oxidoreductase [Chloroflexi bacterium]|nr:FAD-binding oxidoreductase [Chloroflexota bacterium]
MSVTADVVVIGGGIMGTSAAFQLARQGLRVILAEKKFLGAGSTGKSSAVIRQHYSNEGTIRMALYSLRIFQNFADAVGGDPGFVQTGVAMLSGAPDLAGFEANVALQQRVGVNARMISLAELRELDPSIATTGTVAAAYEPEGGYADPVLTMQSYADAAKRLGAEIWQETRVERVLMEVDHVVGVETTRGKIAAPNVVNCANAWAAEIARTIGIELPIWAERHQIGMFQHPANVERPRLTAGDFVNQFYYRPDGQWLTLVGSLDAGPRVENPDEYKESADDEFVVDYGERLMRRYPVMERAFVKRGYAGLYGVTPDWHPIIDEVPEGSGSFVTAGFSGHGFKLGPAVGIMIADMVTRARTPTAQLERSLFEFARFAKEGKVARSYAYGVVA